MKKYFIILAIFTLFFGCGRVGDKTSDIQVSGIPKADSGDIVFDLRAESQLVDKNGNSYVDNGHYSLLVQAKDKNNNPIGNLTNLSYELFENNTQSTSGESKVFFSQDVRSTTNKILLLLDFSGSLISDCENISVISANNSDNLCYQLIESAKQFIKDTISDQQPMAIYYFDSRRDIHALVTSTSAEPTSDIDLLIAGIEKVYETSFRQNLEGFNSTNLNGGVIAATKIACSWVDACNYAPYTPKPNTNLSNFEFASVVTFTDGQDTAALESESEMLKFIKKHESLYYYTIGLGNVDKDVLESIGRDKYIPVSQNSDLNGAFEDLSTQLQAWGSSFYQVDYCPSTREGNVDIKIKASNEQYFGVISDTIKLPENVDFRCDL